MDDTALAFITGLDASVLVKRWSCFGISPKVVERQGTVTEDVPTQGELMTPYAVDRLFQDSLAVGLSRLEADANVSSVIANYPVEIRREISAAIAEVVLSEASDQDVELLGVEGEASQPSQLDSALFRLRKGDKTQKIVFLRT